MGSHLTDTSSVASKVLMGICQTPDMQKIAFDGIASLACGVVTANNLSLTDFLKIDPNQVTSGFASRINCLLPHLGHRCANSQSEPYLQHVRDGYDQARIQLEVYTENLSRPRRTHDPRQLRRFWVRMFHALSPVSRTDQKSMALSHGSALSDRCCVFRVSIRLLRSGTILGLLKLLL